MPLSRRSLVALNVVGGAAVLGSYAFELTRHPGSAGSLWGGVPASLVPLYTINMFVAAAGYFPFSWFFYAQLAPGRGREGDPPGLATLHLLYAMILIPSALWLPLTFAMLESPTLVLWWTIRIVLFSVGIGSLGLLVAIARTPSPKGLVPRAVAMLGILPFAFQTAVLDALVWPAFFDF